MHKHSRVCIWETWTPSSGVATPQQARVAEERTEHTQKLTLKYCFKLGCTNAKDYPEHMANHIPSVHVGTALTCLCVAEIGHSKTIFLKLSDVVWYYNL